MVKYDKYLLAHVGPFHVDGHKEMDILLELEEQSAYTSFTGKVYNQCGYPIETATVMIYDMDENLLSQRKTNRNGTFIFERLNRRHYLVAVSAEGYLLTELTAIEIEDSEITRLDFFLKRNPLEIRGIIYGRILGDNGGLPIKNCEVLLVDINETLYARTFSNDEGQFLLYDIKPADYLIYTYHPKYKKSVCTLHRVKSGSKICHDFSLLPMRNASHAINGKIIRGGDVPAAYVPVFLFRILKNCDSGELIKKEITNGSGLFYFDGLQDGDYIVKAKLSDDEPSLLQKYSLWNNKD